MQIESNGSGSSIDLSALASFSGTSGYPKLTVTQGGTVLDGDLTSLSGVSVTLDGTGTLATNQWTSLTYGSVTITGGAYTLEVPDFDGSSAYVDAGDSLTLQDVTGYANPTGGTTSFEATGAGSTLSLPNLTSLGKVNDYLEVEALQGGQIDLPSLTAITGTSPYVQIESNGSGSSIDLSALTSFSGTSGYPKLTVTQGGTVLDGDLTSLSGVTVTLDGTGTLATNQWTSLTYGSLTITGGEYTLDLTDFDGSSAYVNAGDSLTLQDVTEYANPAGGTTYFQATGAGSTLSLPNLTTLGKLNDYLEVQALQGGQTDLPSLNAITSTSPYVQIESNGSGSSVDLSALTTFSGATGLAKLTVTQGGTVLDGDLASLSGVSVTLDGTGTLATNQWTSLTYGSVTITGGAYTLEVPDFDGSSAYVDAGDSLTLQDVTEYANPAGGTTYFQATGAGSTFSLPNLTTVGKLNDYLEVQALQGGQTDLPSLNAITSTSPYVQIESNGSDSSVDLSALTTFSGATALAELTVTQGGTVLDGDLTSLSGVSVTLDGTGTLATNQWTSLTYGSVTITGGAYTLEVPDFDGSSAYVDAGDSLTLQGVTGYANPTGGTTSFEATGAGSTLSLPNLTSLGKVNDYLEVEALQGGQTDLPSLTAITGTSPYVQIESNGSGSSVDLSSLTTFSGATGLAKLTVTQGGTVLDGDLTSLSGVSVTLDGTGTLATNQWTSLTYGSVTITGGAYTLDLTDFDGSSAYVDAGDSLTLPDVTSYSNLNGGTSFLRATGAGSTLSLPNLTSLGTVHNYLEVQALQGGQTDLPSLTAITSTSPYVQIESNGSGSSIDLSDLTSFSGTSGYPKLTVTQGGTVLDPNLTTFANVTITTDPTATFAVPATQTFSFPSGTTTINTGTVLDQGTLSLQSNATLDIEGGLTINGQGSLSTSSNSTLEVSGNLLGNTTNNGAFNPQGTLILDSATGTTKPPQLLEATSQDLGNVAAGYSNNFAYGTLELTANTYVELVDNAANSPGSAPEAIYANTLIVPAGATLNLDGLHVYAHTEQLNGTIVNGGAIVNGEVYDDVNANGSPDSGEPGLAGWTVELLGASDNTVYSTTTNASGDYSFTGVTSGSYTVAEVLQSGYAQTAPASPGTYSVTVASGQTVNNQNFGNFATATFSGVVFNDPNGEATPLGIQSTFNSNDEGWQIVSFGDLSTNDYSVMGVYTPTYNSTGGDPGGYISTTDPDNGDFTFGAPSFFLGDQSDATGLSYDLTHPQGATNYQTTDVMLVGDGLRLLWESNPPIVPGTGWTQVSVNFAPSGSWHLNTTGGAPATAANFQSVLGDLTGLYIRGEYTDGPELAGLDNVQLIGAVQPGLSGWKVQLLSSSNTVVSTATTNSNGAYTFMGVGPGNYTIQEETQSGYVATPPTSYTVTATNGLIASGYNFGEFSPVTLGGEVFNDLNGDGSLEGGEPGLAGWTVKLIDASNEVVDTATTNSSGGYSFTGLVAGLYTIQLVQQGGYVASTATSLSVTATSGQNLSAENFGEFVPVTLSGEVYNDLNGDGKLEAGEPGLSGWTVNLVNGADQTIASATTDSNGDYSLPNVGPGLDTIQVEQQPGFVATTASLSLTPSSGTNVPGLDLGEFQTVTISGEVFNDPTDTGQFLSGDTGLSGWTVELVNGTQVIQTTSASDGTYSFSNIGPGSYTLEVVQQTGWVATNSPVTIAPTSGANISGEYLGEFQGLTISGQVFNDIAGSGIFASGDPGLAGWTIDLLDAAHNVVATAQTGGNGDFTLGGVVPGRYTVAEVPQTGFVQTTSPASFNVTVVAGQSFSGLTFGDFRLATVTGEVFDDAHDDGTLDTGDAGLAGWTLQLLNSLNKVVSAATTDSNGNYSFNDVGPGIYGIAAVAEPGYVQTAPGSGPITISATSGATLGEQDFGEFKSVSLAVSDLVTTPASGLQSGMALVVGWTDTNTGTQPASGSFNDQIVVTNTTTGDVLATGDVLYNAASLGNLAAGASAAQQYTFSLPNGEPGVGQIQFTVTADYDQNVSTPVGEPNDTDTLTEASTLGPYAELVPSSITGISSANPGEQTSVGWTLTNTGSAAATGPWTEQAFLATDAAGDNPTLLSAQSFTGTLGVNQSVSRSMTVVIPSLPQGTYWLVVIADAFGEVYELDTASSTAVAAQSTSLAAGLTLTLASSTVSNNAGSDATTATVTRNTSTMDPLVVTIANSDTTDVSVPQTVTIAAGATSATFAVGTINTGIADGNQTATLTATAAGLATGSAGLSVTNVNVPALTVVLNSQSVNETDTNPATFGTVTRDTPTTSALTVSLLSSDTNKLTVPATVTIPAGQVSVTFPVTVINDAMIDGNESATITASASGFQSASDSATVVDDNVPTLSLTLAQSTVSEAAGADATTGTVSIASPATEPLTIVLGSSLTSAATVPASVVIDAGQESASFPIAALNSGLDVLNQTAVITANVETYAGVVVTQGSAEASLLLLNANGPALTLSFVMPTVAEGSTVTATVTRNTNTTGALVVTLTSTDPTAASVPPTVTIPAGQSSVTFLVDAVQNGVPVGMQQIQISATTTGLDTGLATLGITDVQTPDLVVSSVSAPASGYDNTPLSISWTVTNSGDYPATGSWVDEVFLDPAGGSESTNPVDSVTFTGSLNPGQSYTQTVTIQSPSSVGQYFVRVLTDSGDSVQELSYTNNTGVAGQPYNDQAAYTATVTPSASVVSAGTPVVLSGVATLTSDNAPAANVAVAVQILVDGTSRTLTGTTTASGDFSVTFQPLPDEAGSYSVTAADPGVTNPAVQAQFEIVGMSASPATGNVTVVPDTPLTGTFTLTNLSDVMLTGLTATYSGAPTGMTVQLTVANEIAGDGTAPLSYTLNDTSTQGASGVITIALTTTQGAVLDLLVGVSVDPLKPVLAANPGYLDTGMVVGDQTLVSFTVVNNGGAPSGALDVSLPSTSYMTLASPATIPSLAPGASTTVTVELTPPASLPLEEYTGTIGIGGPGIGMSVPFTFTAITTAVGNVSVLVDDNYTFEEAGAPHVQGATVSLLNPYDNTDVVATGTTDASGSITFTSVLAGPYDLQVTAPGHSSYDNSFTVTPGVTNSDEVFIAEQFVTYTWNVVQTTIQDTYQIQLQTTFQTDVPAPVVTITTPSSIPTLVPGQSWTFNATITNHGLIAAQGVTLTMPTDPEYTFTALSTDIGVVPAESSIEVPITVTRIAPQSISISDGGTTFTASVVVPNPVGQDTASTVYVDYTNTGDVAIPAPLLMLTATQGSSQGGFLSLDSSLAGLAYNSNETPSGFSSAVQFLASGATPGMLEPGESEQIPVYYSGLLSSQWSSSTPVTFSLSEVDATDTDAVDWPSVLPGLQPGSINSAAWSAIGPILAQNMGSTWGQYVQTVDSDSAYLAGIGDPTTDVSLLLSFEVEKANAAYFAQALTSVTAADLPAPGMNLTFVQSYQASISGRYTDGVLGYGWTTNWDISATTMTNGDVLINDAGTSAYFSVQPNGSFVPEAGDEGMTLTSVGGAYQLVASDGTTYMFSVNGGLDYIADSDGNRITADYNAGGQLISLTDFNGEYIDLTYNAEGHLATLTDSSGQTETYGYDPTGQLLTSFTDAYGATTYTYVTGESAAQNYALTTMTNAAGMREDVLQLQRRRPAHR